MMRKLLQAFAITVVLITAVAPPVQAQQNPPLPQGPSVGMTSGILVDLQTGKVLWAKNERARLAPASLTKILTALVVLENINLEERATITPAARAAPGARTYAEQGWSFSVRDLLWGLLLQSGNDAAIALAERVSPDRTVGGFMRLVNARAAEMGARDTHFVNPHGYDAPGHMTTARDLALMTAAAMRNPVFAEMVRSPQHHVPWGDGQPHAFFNHNKLLHRYPGTVGVKTGFTRAAGHCLASAVSRDGTTLAAIVLNSPNHYAESRALYDWGFANLATLRAHSAEALQPGAGSTNLELSPASGPAGVGGQGSGLPWTEGLPLLALGLALSMTTLILFRESILNP